LLDTLFILLFALLALSDGRTRTRPDLVRIQLPRVEPSKDAAAEPVHRLVIEVDAGSRIRLQETEILRTRAELDRALSDAVGDALPEEVVIEIQGDRGARHGVTVELLQYLRLRGFTSVYLVARGAGGPSDAFGEAR
jgi:biopolymer transport protein ExbD